MNLHSELSKRVVTGIGGIALILALLIWGGVAGAALITYAISIGMLLEYSNMVFGLVDRLQKRWTLIGVSLFAQLYLTLAPQDIAGMMILAFMGLFLFFLFSAQKHAPNDLQPHFLELMASVFGFFYLGILPIFLMHLRDRAEGQNWVILFFIIIWSADVGAYFSGKKFGQNKLYPAISPHKTIEGSMGGILLSVICAIFFKIFVFK